MLCIAWNRKRKLLDEKKEIVEYFAFLITFVECSESDNQKNVSINE